MAAWRSRKHYLFRVTCVVLLPLACGAAISARTVDDPRAGLACVAAEGDLPWEQVQGLLGHPDEAPIPAPGTLFRNTRVYRNVTVVLHTDTKETAVEGRSQFLEVVKSIELCRTP